MKRVIPLSLLIFAGMNSVAIGDDKDENPHIVVFDDAGAVGVEFEVIAPDVVSGVETVTVFTSSFNQVAGEYTSQPLSGAASGFINDDSAYESKGVPTGSNIRVTLIEVLPGSDPFFVSLGASFITQTGQSFNLGSSFDSHPTYGLLSDDPGFTGSATLVFELSDTNNMLEPSAMVGVRISADPADAVIPSEQCNIADLNADGSLNFFDVSAFLTAFAAMDLDVDFNNDGAFNFFDVSLFLMAFSAGCP